eukprot:COSAG01_NODE_12229_length_1777_cov_1.492849_4_plen_76_part_01
MRACVLCCLRQASESAAKAKGLEKVQAELKQLVVSIQEKADQEIALLQHQVCTCTRIHTHTHTHTLSLSLSLSLSL